VLCRHCMYPIYKPHLQSTAVQEINSAWWERNCQFSVSWAVAVLLQVDVKLFLDEWNPSAYIFDGLPWRQIRVDLGGKHHLRVEHVEPGGFVLLAMKLKKG